MLLPLVALVGCFSLHNSEVTSEYARQVSTASLRVSQLEQELVASQERISQLEEVIRLQGQSEAARLENVDEVNAEVARLRGALEVLEFEGGELKTSVEDQQLAQEARQLHDESRLRQIEQLLGVKPPPPPEIEGLPGSDDSSGPSDGTSGDGDGAVAGEEGDEVVELPESAAGRLEVAVGHMEAGRHAVARAILKRAIDENAGAAEMPEIRYRHGETFFNEEEWRDAILEFQKVPDNHPDTDWACWAYFRQGEAMESMQGLQQAAPFYKGATNGSCKNSEASKQARKKL